MIAIIARVSKLYETSGSCLKVQLSHLNGYCVPGTDPYRDSVKEKKSGCTGIGLLHSVRGIWDDPSRAETKYDVMHLFSGTVLECDSQGCIIGCAFSDSICTKNGFGVNHITFSDSLELQSVLVAHELGHSAGAFHETRENYIMHSRINSASNGFSQESLNSIDRCIKEFNCVNKETDAPSSQPSLKPSELPSAIPTSYPTAKPSTIPSSNPSAKPSFYPSAFPTKHPTSEPSTTPSSLPTSYFPSSSPSLGSSNSPSLSRIRFEESSIPSLNNQFVTTSPSYSVLDTDDSNDTPELGCRSTLNLNSLINAIIDSFL